MVLEQTMAGYVLGLADAEGPGILTPDATVTHREAVAEAAVRGAWLGTVPRRTVA